MDSFLKVGKLYHWRTTKGYSLHLFKDGNKIDEIEKEGIFFILEADHSRYSVLVNGKIGTINVQDPYTQKAFTELKKKKQK